jgi:hypothetical protein
MSKIKLNLDAQPDYKLDFEGEITSQGPSEYQFSGELIVRATQSTNIESFTYKARLGYGASSKDWTYIDFSVSDLYGSMPKHFGESDYGQPLGSQETPKPIEETPLVKRFNVEGEGTRAANESVDFRLGFNGGPTGKFEYGSKVTVTPTPD